MPWELICAIALARWGYPQPRPPPLVSERACLDSHWPSCYVLAHAGHCPLPSRVAAQDFRLLVHRFGRASCLYHLEVSGADLRESRMTPLLARGCSMPLAMLLFHQLGVEAGAVDVLPTLEAAAEDPVVGGSQRDWIQDTGPVYG